MFLSKRCRYTPLLIYHTSTILTNKLYFHHFHFQVRRTHAYPHKKSPVLIKSKCLFETGFSSVLVLFMTLCLPGGFEMSDVVTVIAAGPLLLAFHIPQPASNGAWWLSGWVRCPPSRRSQVRIPL